MAAAKVCIRANVPAEDPVAPADKTAASTPTRNRRLAGTRPDATRLVAMDLISTSLKVVAIARTPVYMSFLYYVKYKIDIIE
jgi:hypothetical protein